MISSVATSQNSKEKLWLLYLCVFLSLFQFVCLVAVSLFFLVKFHVLVI